MGYYFITYDDKFTNDDDKITNNRICVSHTKQLLRSQSKPRYSVFYLTYAAS